MTILVDDLLEETKLRAFTPESQVSLSDAQILRILDRIIQLKIIPLIESTNQNYFVTTEEEDLVAGVREYSIPARSVGRTLRDLKMGGVNSTTDEIENLCNVPLIDISDEQYYQSQSYSMKNCGFYFFGDKIKLVPKVPTQIQALRLQKWYRIAVSSMVLSDAAMLVQSVSDPDVIVSSVPDGYEAGVLVDFIQGESGCSILGMDAAITNVSGTTITFAADTIPLTLQAGDWISLAGTSPVVTMIPNEAESLIQTLGAQRILKILGDSEGAKDLTEDMQEEMKYLLQMLQPRIDGEPIVIINRNGLLRSRVGSYSNLSNYIPIT